VRGKTTAKPLLHILATAAGQVGYLLLTVGTAIDTLRDLAYLLGCETLGIKKIEQTGTLLALATYQTKKHRIEITAATTRDAQRKLKTMTVPTAGTETVALLMTVLVDEQLTLVRHQGIHD
jgi:hypothetical protein